MRSSLLLFLMLLPKASSAELVDRIVAIIDSEVITLSEAEQAQRIGLMRLGESLSLREVVDRLIERRLVVHEVERFGTDAVPERQVDEAVIDLTESFESPEAFAAALADNGLSPEELRAELREQLRVTRYLDKRFRSLTYVSDEEVARFFDEELLPGLPTGTPVPAREEYDEQIRRILEERKLNERIDRWMEELGSRATIRRYVW